MTILHDLARAAGLHIDWEDAFGKAQRVADTSIIAILAALGYPADSDAKIIDSMARLMDSAKSGPSFVSAVIGQPILLPAACGAAGLAELILESGAIQQIHVEADADNLGIPAITTPGYHRLMLGQREISLAIAPEHCFSIADAVGERRLWGPSVQIAALRDDTGNAFGDFGALAHTARAFAAQGADVMAISPVHALFPADASRFSPYAPSSRDFINILFADPALVGAPSAGVASGELIDWEQATPARLHALRRAFDQRPETVRAQIAEYALAGGEALEAHARFDALHAHFLKSTGASTWREWPAPFHDPAGDAVAEFARDNRDDVDFFVFAQWLATHSLDVAQRAALDGGMAIGLIADLAVGMDAGGSHAWRQPDDLLTGLSIGAPPDLLGPDGQGWGITGFSPQALQRTGFKPFIATLRAALAHAGGIRIDHVLGLRRLWVIPDGAPPSDGAYLTMPMDDLFRLVALESHRARAVVIGEDLGTVPDGFRPKMDEKDMLGMRVLWFQRDATNGFSAPQTYESRAAAMTGTHDLPTVAGWWQGRDIAWRWQLGRASAGADKAADDATRADERSRLWQAFVAAGVAAAPEPARENPDPVVDAALAFIGSTPSVLAIVPMEDVIGAVEQPNLPGTIDEHPNWRRRMPGTTHDLLNSSMVAARLAALNAERTA